MEIKNLKKAALRIKKAVKNKEPIIVYADSDLDGVTSAVIMKETIMNLGGSVSQFYFPDRETEGYGVTVKGLKLLKKHAPALFMTLDCGISSVDEIDSANKLGFETIVIDHHEVPEKLPNASIIVDPKQKGDKYPFKLFANVGLTLKLAEVILGDKMTDNLRRDFVQLAAMATIADMMPKIDENEIIIAEGLNYIDASWRPGIKVLLDMIDYSDSVLERVYKINSYLNIRDVENPWPIAFRLLISSDESEAKELAKDLLSKGAEKKRRISEITDQVKMLVSSKPKEEIVFEGNSSWELVLLGIVAAYLVKEYNKPVFLYKKLEKESHGSVRAPEGFNTVEAMKTFKDKLVTFGGHPPASGFRIKNKYLEEFKEALIDYFSK